MYRHALMALLLASIPATAHAADDATRAKAGTETKARVGFDRGFFIHSADGDYALNIRHWSWARFQFDSVEGSDLSRTNRYAFSIPQARLILMGHFFSPNLHYFFQMDFGDGQPSLIDLHLDWQAVPGKVHLRVGQFRRPWSREHLAAGPHIPFTNATQTGGAFRAGRDIGVMIHNGYRQSPEFEYAIGLFNGTGIKARLEGVKLNLADETTSGGRFVNVPTSFKPALVVRLGYNHNKIKGYQFTDFDKGSFRWALAFGGMLMMDTEDSASSLIAAQVDLLVKFRGLTISAAGYVTSTQVGPSFDDQDWERAGFHVHAGYLIGPRDWVVRPEVVARYAQIAERGGVDVEEATAGINLFFEGYGIRWSTDVALAFYQPRLAADGPDTTDYQLRTQLQLSFF